MKELMTKISIIIAIVTVIFGCSASNTNLNQSATGEKESQGSYELQPYVIMPGDQLDIKFFYNPELNETITVRPDGMISLQLVDDVMAAGLEPKELDQQLSNLYKEELKKPVLTVIVRSFSGQRIYVGGEVQTEGLIEMLPGLTVMQAVFQAGGFLDTAQPAETLIIRKGEGNRPIPIKVDLMASMNDKANAKNIYLKPDDVVFIPKSPIAKANLFVNQYIERLLLFRGVSFGFSYTLNDDNNN